MLVLKFAFYSDFTNKAFNFTRLVFQYFVTKKGRVKPVNIKMYILFLNF